MNKRTVAIVAYCARWALTTVLVWAVAYSAGIWVGIFALLVALAVEGIFLELAKLHSDVVILTSYLNRTVDIVGDGFAAVREYESKKEERHEPAKRL